MLGVTLLLTDILGVTETLIEGVTDAVGVTLTEILGVTEGVIEGLTDILGVTETVILGVTVGVTDIDGLTDIEGVGLGVTRYIYSQLPPEYGSKLHTLIYSVLLGIVIV
jgi:hypothetical protein